VLRSTRLPPGFGLTRQASDPLASGSPPTTFRVRAVLLPDVCAEEVMPDHVMPREVESLTCLICGRTINAGEPRYRTPDGDVDVRCYEWKQPLRHMDLEVATMWAARSHNQ
jgi:hypothetical protein